MPREHHPHVGDAGVPECLYAGCGQEIPPDHYLCLRHYKKHQDGQAGPCPSPGCRRFRSLDYERCADCGRAAAPETDPAWEAGDVGCDQVLCLPVAPGRAFLCRPHSGTFASGSGNTAPVASPPPASRPRTSAKTSARLVWFQEYSTRAEAADRELELKQLVLRDRRAVLRLVFQFQDAVRLVSPLLSS